MSFLRRIAVVVALGLVCLVVVRTFHAWRGEKRLTAAKAVVDASCRSYRMQRGHEDSHVCAFDAYGPAAIAILHRAQAGVAAANTAIARGDVAAADRALVSVTADVRDLNRHGMVGTLMAADIVAAVLDMVAAHPLALDARSVLSNLELPDSERPFDGWRADRMWLTARYREERLPDAPVLDAAEIADEIEQEDATYRAMERSVLAGDVAQCERSARDLGATSGGAAFNAGLCRKLANVVRMGQRLQAAR